MTIQNEIQAVILEVVGTSAIPFEEIKKAVRSTGVVIRNWGTVRKIIADMPEIVKLEGDEELYRVVGDVPAELPSHVQPKLLTLPQIKDLCKKHGIPCTKTTPREKILHQLSVAHGWENENIQVVEYLLAGGKVEEVPGFVGVAPRERKEPTKAVTKTPRKVTPKTSNGVVTLQSILEELNVEPRLARRKLRASEIAKPGDSWTWNEGHADIEAVKELLQK